MSCPCRTLGNDVRLGLTCDAHKARWPRPHIRVAAESAAEALAAAERDAAAPSVALQAGVATAGTAMAAAAAARGAEAMAAAVTEAAVAPGLGLHGASK